MEMMYVQLGPQEVVVVVIVLNVIFVEMDHQNQK